MTGNQLSTLVDEINGGAAIGSTLKLQLLNLAKALVEQRRPWMVLRNTDTSKTVSTSNTWQTQISLTSIDRLSRFFGEDPIKLFNGAQTIFEYRQVPFDKRLQHMLDPDTFVYDEPNSVLYLNGTPPFAGTLYIDHIKTTADISETDDPIWTPFPSWAHPILAFIANGIHKGGIDYDDINARMAPENRGTANEIMRALEAWDMEKQLSAQQMTDPYRGSDDGWRPNAVNIRA